MSEPRDLIAAFSAARPPSKMRPEDFRRALSLADLDLLRFVDVPDFERLAWVVEAYPSVERLHLLTTRTREGTASLDWLPLLRAHLADRGFSREVLASAEHAVLLSDDGQVIGATREAARKIFETIASSAGQDAAPVLADLTGGSRAVGLGLALACLASGREMLYLGTRYDPEGGTPRAPFAFTLPGDL
jgi:hypothetical protein